MSEAIQQLIMLHHPDARELTANVITNMNGVEDQVDQQNYTEGIVYPHSCTLPLKCL